MALKIQCRKHPKYNGKKEPLASCEGCQFVHALRLEIQSRSGVPIKFPDTVEVSE